MATTDNKALVRQFYEDMLGPADHDLFDALVAEDMYDARAARLGLPQGRAGFRDHLAAFHEGLGDARIVVDDMIAEEDRVVAYWTASGVNRGALGFPLTGKQISFRGVTLLRLRDGQVSEYRSLADAFTLMRDLGLVPAPAPTDQT